MNILINIVAFLGAFAFMEGFAWFTHKYIMHGWGWFLHKSHHEPRKGWFELNDLYAIIFAAPAIYFMWIGSPAYNWVFWTGTGISAYGMSYFFFHDVLVHRRLHHKMRPTSRYMQRIMRAHKIHHKNMGRKNGKAFGFLFALPEYDVKRTDK
jgi:beta-carotene 3-hydroxylase